VLPPLNKTSVIAAATSIPTDWHAMVATIIHARLRLGRISET
jgi:hypothetical protein